MSFLCRETTSLLQQEPIYNMSCQVDKVAVFFFRFFLNVSRKPAKWIQYVSQGSDLLLCKAT